MLNQWVRYAVLARIIRRHDCTSICEVGSGSHGIGPFIDRPFTGCDVSFADFEDAERPIHARMRAVRMHGETLPFADASFDLVFSTDTLEHLDPARRAPLVAEMVRVARRHVVIGFPCDAPARRSDVLLRRVFQSIGKREPRWLAEHLDNPAFPTSELARDLFAGGALEVELFKNEPVWLHVLLALFEAAPLGHPLSTWMSTRRAFRWPMDVFDKLPGDRYRLFVHARKPLADGARAAAER
jgi:hypothetical protein